MSFAGNAKRAALDYEADLAAYTSTGVDSPGHHQRPSKRRALGTPGASTSGTNNTSATATTMSSFVQLKTGYFQQHVEHLNQHFKDRLATLGDTEEDKKKSLFLASEYLRLMKEFRALYQLPMGDVLAMGNDDCLALGVSITEDDDKLLEYPPTLTRNIPANIVQVAAGGTHSVALSEEGEVFTWGNNDDYALGREVGDGETHKAGKVDIRDVTMVAAGDNHTLYLDIEGDVYMTGMYKDMDSGKFANVKPGEKLKKGVSQKKPVQVSLPKPVYKIGAGNAFNAAVLQDGSLYTWGMGHSGELARSSSMGAPLLPSDSGIPQYDLGKTFIGEIYTTMEKNREGEMEEVENYRYHTDLINGKFLTPAPVEWDEPGDYHVLDMALGECHMVVVARKGNAGQTRVYSCGHNNYGQLGHGDRVQRHVLTPINQLDCEGIVQVECGTFHTLFLAGMGKLVFACGRSDYGQLGLFDEKEKIAGGYQDTPVPVPFPKEIGNTRISFIAAGANNSACVADTGDVYAWGFNATASTGHPSKVRRGSDDMERVTKLNPMRYYKKTKGMAIMGTDATVSSLSLGGQHSLMVVQRFK